MGRPPHPLGVSGKVRIYRTESGWRARTTYHDHDGVTREVQRHGRTKAAAERALAIAREGPLSSSRPVVAPDKFFPADSLLPGATPAQDANAAAVGNRVMYRSRPG